VLHTSTIIYKMTYVKALEHFKKYDPVLFEIAVQVGPLEERAPIEKKHYFANLCESIVSQQLSIKAADTIWGRVLALYPKKRITPTGVLKIDDETYRKCGMSYAKIRYMKDLAKHTIDGTVKFMEFPTLSNEEITKELLLVKGIGPWTAEMFLMFTMAKGDIFSPGDQGLKNAMKKLKGLKKPVKWSPYRSYASRILWKSLELKD
jgi:DNA-3-methyladenine glycosylase II